MTSAEACIGAALEFEKQELWQKAAVQYQRAIELSPECAQSHYQLGIIWSKLKRMDISVCCYQRAFKLNTESYLYCITFAQALKLQGRITESIETFQAAIKLDTTNPDGYQQIGDIYLTKERFPDAISAYKEAINLETKNPWTFVNLGRAYIRLHLYRDALPHIRHAIRLRPDFGPFYIHLGEAFDGDNCMQEALDAYSKATQLEPKNVRFYCALGDSYNKYCRFSEAIPCFVEAIKNQPQYRTAYKPLGFALYKTGEISLDERNHIDGYVIPDRVVDLLFEPLSVEEVGVDSVEFQSIASQAGEDIVLMPRSITASAPSYDGNGREKYLESAKVLPAHLLEVKDGRAWFDGADSAVMTASGKVISAVSNRNSRLVASASQDHDLLKIEGVVVYISQRFAAGSNYFHWFFQDVARLHLLELAGIRLNDIDKFVFVQIRKDFQQETLDVLGIPASKVIQSLNEPHICASRLLVPSLTNVLGTSKWACDYLRDRFVGSLLKDSDKNSTSGKVYITRNSAPCRHVVNEDDLIPLLKAHDFEVVKMEALSIEQKVTLLSQAKVVITAHGAALTNLVFCSPGATVVEMFPCSATDSMDMFGSYSVVAHQCMLEHHYFFADNVPNQESTPVLRKDLLVDVSKFKKMLECIV